MQGNPAPLQTNKGNASPPAGKPIRIAAGMWILITALALMGITGVYLAGGRQGLLAFIQVGPNSDLHYTLMAVVFCWLLVGGLAALLRFSRLHAGNVATWAGFFSVAFLYAGVLRERIVSGDVSDYINAAVSLHSAAPLPARYLYPPLWATLLEPLVPLGERVMLDACWLLNLVSLCAFYFLLQRALRVYGFSERLSALAVTGFMLANVAILRTLVVGQVNLHVANLVLLCLLAYPKRKWLSALALSLAVHFKLSPVILALAFLWLRDFTWLGWFTACTLALSGVTLAANGVSPYFNFLANIRSIYLTTGIAFRENSFDSFFRALGGFAHLSPGLTLALIAAAKFLLAGAALWVAGRWVRRRAFAGQSPAESMLLNSYPALLILAVMLSPVVWTHHPVLLALPYLLLMAKLVSSGEWLLFGLAYFLEFLLPTFDFFPFSYGRLLSPLIWLALAWRAAAHPGSSRIFDSAIRWLDHPVTS